MARFVIGVLIVLVLLLVALIADALRRINRKHIEEGVERD